MLCVASVHAQYSQRVWQSTDGLPEDFAQAIAQTPDGYLWVGTSGGLVRFDGVRFTLYNRANEPAFRDDSIYSLATARDGTLWIGSEGGGLIRYRAGVFRAYGANEGLTNGFVRVTFEDRNGTLWVGTDRGLFRMEGDRFVRVNEMAVHSIYKDRARRILIAGSGLVVMDQGKATTYRSSESQADNAIRTIRETRDGALWIGTISGLRRLEHGLDGDPFAVRRMLNGANISVLREARDGRLWIGTYGQGLMRYTNGRVERVPLPHNNVLALFDDSEDDLWVGTQGGLVRLSPSAAATINPPDHVPQSINTIYQDPRGTLFVAALNGRLFQAKDGALQGFDLPPALRNVPIRNVFRDRSGTLWLGTDGQGVVRGNERFTMREGLVNDFVRAFCEDAEGSIWTGTDGGLSRYHAGRFENFGVKEGLAYGSVRALMMSRGGELLIGTDGGLSRRRGDTFVNELRGEKIWALYEDVSGGLWIGTHGGGLILKRGDALTAFTTKDGLHSNTIHYVTEDARGNLWMSGPGGIASVSRADLENRVTPLALRVYGTSEGLTTNQMNGGVQPAGAITPGGELWFASSKGAVRIDPEAPAHTNRGRVAIEEVLADDHPTSFANGLQAGPGAGKLEIHYTAIRLRSPERTQFKFWMENFDPKWTEAGQRRIAYYTNLPAGTYRFHVAAYERNDPTNTVEAILNVTWRPHFYQSAWFLSLCALAAVTAAYGGYRLHLRNLRARFAAVLEERNRLAREMHDTLIQGCVGVSTLLEAASSAQQVSPEAAHALMDRARDEVRATVDEARLAVWNLRKGSVSADTGAAIADLGRRIGEETGIPVRVEGGDVFHLRAEAERSLLMVIREALYNAVRHGAPHSLTVAIRAEHGDIGIDVIDDGTGFDPVENGATGHYGLVGMRERVTQLGGDMRIESRVGQGTKLRLRIPADS